MRSSLGKVRGMGSAKSGTDHFLKQRITAIANIPCVIFFIAFFIIYGSSPIEDICSVISHPVIASIMGIGILSIALHMKIGMQVIIEDYIHSHLLKIICIVLNSFFVISCVFLSLMSILKIIIVGQS
ncbi:MAG: succinate dehydrogenase, hydrophobic membrane anchor protein [Candidatus Liberibacter ctenarytainae]|uniref:Succinate dehydrogenase hydrophobic membrane anchor subunit n=1 Tax=Candidatus Liberibacter ctenarytainae TaxID=2020335 RepID=A0A937ASK9_9HYPH|nr:succinate dehydrogenase, hydrophobic membrane anchor protein [Candidatus Liberibacter ctenarytainae]